MGHYLLLQEMKVKI